MSETTVSPSSVSPSAAMRRWQVGLVVAGLLLLVVGAIALFNDVAPSNYVGILIWFVGALVIHDGIAAPIIFVIALLLRRAGKRIPFAVIAIVQGALVVAVITTLVALPQALKKEIGTNNATILPLDYGVNLIGFYLGLAVVTAVTIAGYLLLRARRRKSAATPSPG